MKIYILPVHADFQPASQPFRYPKYNDDYGVEQDFLAYLRSHPALISSDAQEAEWHYLPVFWTRYHLNRARRPEGLPELQKEVERIIHDDRRTFTVCQFDDGPLVDLGNTVQCLASRKNASTEGIDIPLLSSPIPGVLNYQTSRRYSASFLGQFKNHSVRSELYLLLSNRPDVYFRDGDFGIDAFVNTILESHIGICPRGYGGSSFRLFEVMQSSRVPLLVGDVDPRPFRRFFPWDEFSFYVREPEAVSSLLDYALTKDLEKMGIMAREVWKSLHYQKWCSYLLLEIGLQNPESTRMQIT